MPDPLASESFQRLADDMAYEQRHGQGKQGTATRHITANYDTTMGRFDPNKSVGTLDSKAERYKALNELTQQQTGGGDFDSEARCGAMVLLGGSMLAGGSGGIATLINAVEAFKKGNTKGPLDEETLKQMADLEKIKEKITKGAELTAGDLTSVSTDVFGMMFTGDKQVGGGMKDKDVEALMKSSPELRKMWKKNDLSYDSIDPNGGGSGGHAVLGIGHGSSDADHNGPHSAIYDPYHRARMNTEAQKEVEELERQAAESDGPIHGYAVKMAVARMKANQRQELGQLITDPRELKAYQNATMKGFEFNGSDKEKGVHYRGYNPTNVFNGMY